MSKNLRDRKATETTIYPPISPASQTVPVPEDENEADGPTFGRPYRDPIARDDQVVFPLDHLELAPVTNDRLVELFLTRPRVHHHVGVRIVHIAKSLVIKGGWNASPGEGENMILAAQSLHLPVPKVYHTFGASNPDDGGRLCPITSSSRTTYLDRLSRTAGLLLRMRSENL